MLVESKASKNILALFFMFRLLPICGPTVSLYQPQTLHRRIPADTSDNGGDSGDYDGGDVSC